MFVSFVFYGAEIFASMCSALKSTMAPVIAFAVTALAWGANDIDGTVTDQGQAVAAAPVGLFDLTSTLLTETTGDEAGAFAFPAVDPGSYSLVEKMIPRGHSGNFSSAKLWSFRYSFSSR